MIPCLKPDIGALDHMPRTSGETIVISSIEMTSTTFSAGAIENPMAGIRPMPDSGWQSTNQKQCVSISADLSLDGT